MLCMDIELLTEYWQTKKKGMSQSQHPQISSIFPEKLPSSLE
jgi:hypothetical protein